MKLEYLIKHKSGDSPLICLEVNPPRGVDFEGVFNRLGSISGIDFFNVTDSALARMRAAPLPFAAALKARFGIEPLVNISCRDRNLIALQGDLLSGWNMGVHSIIALTGDAVTIGDSPERKGVFEVNSIGLLQAVNTLNSGKDLANNELQGAPSYIAGVVVNPNAKNINAEIRRLEKKHAAGARYALSQPVFDSAAAKQFFTSAAAIGIPILMGLMAFRSAKAASNIVNVPGIKLSADIIKMIEGAGDRDLTDDSINFALNLACNLKGMVAGFHVVSGTTPKLAQRLAMRLIELK